MSGERPQGVPGVLWHPEQKLWNQALARTLRRRLGGGAAGRLAIATVLLLDSLLLWLRVQVRSLRRRAGAPAPGRATGPRPQVLYVDCGVHKRGEQIRWMHRWFSPTYDLRILGFEASEEHCRDAREALADIDGVQLFNVALVGPRHEGDVVRLYKSAVAEGKADSLLADSRADYDDVPARRLSSVLREECPDLAGMPVLLRMNVEGAEHMILEDLVDAGLDGSIDGYYGMWDDVRDHDPEQAQAMRRLMRERGISNVTFNDRDLITAEGRRRGLRGIVVAIRSLAFTVRRAAIRRDIEVSIGVGMARKAPSAVGASEAPSGETRSTATP